MYPEFEALTADFTKPTGKDILDGTVEFDYTQGPFINVFFTLGQMMALEEEEEAERDHPSRDYFWMSRSAVEYLINILLGKIHLDTWL